MATGTNAIPLADIVTGKSITLDPGVYSLTIALAVGHGGNVLDAAYVDLKDADDTDKLTRRLWQAVDSSRTEKEGC